MAELNAINRGVYIADNLEFLRSLNDECIDLILIDPPFSKHDEFVSDQLKPPLTAQEREIERRLLARWGIHADADARKAGVVLPEGSEAGFTDIWSWERDIHEDWLKGLEENFEGLHRVIEAARYLHSDGMAAYMCYMSVRIIEIHRILKPTGTLYLHCDNTANSYIRQLLDGVFGARNFRNELVWHYGKMSNTKTNFPKNHDTIYRYSKSDQYVFTPIPGGDSEYRERFKRDLTGNQVLYGSVKDRSDRLITGRIRRREQELGRALADEDVLFDFDLEFKTQSDVIYQAILRGNQQERTGYPTQKPVALAERIVQASSRPGDVVLDCFAGCAYAAIAAEKLDRRWIACDFNPRAWTVLKRQFSKPNLALLRCNDETTGQAVLGNEPVVTVHGPAELPLRTTPIAAPEPKAIELPTRAFKVPASIIPEREMLERLLEFSGYQAWCCGFANRRADGAIIRTTRNFHLDHLQPESKDGSHQITNRAPMCPSHNIRKSNRLVYLQDYRREIADAGELCVERIDDLVDLAAAAQFALDEYATARKQQTDDGQPLTTPVG